MEYRLRIAKGLMTAATLKVENRTQLRHFIKEISKGQRVTFDAAGKPPDGWPITITCYRGVFNETV